MTIQYVEFEMKVAADEAEVAANRAKQATNRAALDPIITKTEAIATGKTLVPDTVPELAALVKDLCRAIAIRERGERYGEEKA